jgi:DNA-binding NarL/FixJ family response regulator
MHTAIFASGIAALVDSEPDMRCLGTTTSGTRLVELAARLGPDVVIVDLLLSDVDPPALVPEILASRPSIRVLSLGDAALRPSSLAPLRFGAHGLLLKDCEPTELIDAIRHVYRGKTYLSPSVASLLIAEVQATDGLGTRDARPGRLSPQEVRVLELLASGRSNRAIALALGLSERTVENHLRRVYRKLGVPDRAQAILAGLRAGYLPSALVARTAPT